MKLIKDIITMYGMYFGGTTHVRPVVSSRKRKEFWFLVQLAILAALLIFAGVVLVCVINGVIHP